MVIKLGKDPSPTPISAALLTTKPGCRDTPGSVTPSQGQGTSLGVGQALDKEEVLQSLGLILALLQPLLLSLGPSRLPSNSDRLTPWPLPCMAQTQLFQGSPVACTPLTAPVEPKERQT